MWCGVFLGPQEENKASPLQRGNLFKGGVCALELQYAHSPWSVLTGPILRPNPCHSIRPSTCQTALDQIPVEDKTDTPAGKLILGCQTTRHPFFWETKKKTFSDSWPYWHQLEVPTCAFAAFIVQTYKKKKKYMSQSNLAVPKSHINRNILPSSQRFGITEIAERREPTSLKSLGWHSGECSGQQHLG